MEAEEPDVHRGRGDPRHGHHGVTDTEADEMEEHLRGLG
jgi:hypothetical protein